MRQAPFAPPPDSVAVPQEDRLQEWHRRAVHDDEAGASLDDICALAQSFFGTAAALILLVDETATVLSTSGPADEALTHDACLCAKALQGDGVAIAEDVTCDPRITTTLRGDLRFYAGAPLVLRDGLRIGALCLLDLAPRGLSPTEATQLQNLAKLAINELRRRHAMADLHHQHGMLAHTARMTKTASWSFDLATERFTWSAEAYRMLEVAPEAVPSFDLLRQIFGAEAAETFGNALRNIGKRGAFDQTQQMASSHGMTRWIKCTAELDRAGLIKGIARPRVIGSFQDVTAQHVHVAAIEWLANRDPLTGLPNRAYFQDRLTAAIAEAERKNGNLGLVLVDIDHFKDLNNTLGFETGDTFLCALSEWLPAAFGESEHVFRLSGDEFAVILPDLASEAELAAGATRLLALMDAPKETGKEQTQDLSAGFSVTASIASAIYPRDDRNATQLMKDAEIALAKAKAGGRNQHVGFEPFMREEIDARLALLRQVREGLAAHQFVLYYQPIVKIEPPEAVVGFEALMRLQHPTRGVLTPDKFFAAFEDQELSLLMGDVALDSALAQMRLWLEEGVAFGRIAINLSPAQFRNGNLVETITRKLAAAQMPADRLILEVTEHIYMGWGSNVVSDTIKALHDAGVVIELDDFGTGYASLTNLKQFPIDGLKIDKSFIRDLHDPAIVSALIMLGKGLGISIIAEGVERAAQLELLREMGCDLVQGHYYARPMPAAEVKPYLAHFGEGPGARAVA